MVIGERYMGKRKQRLKREWKTKALKEVIAFWESDGRNSFPCLHVDYLTHPLGVYGLSDKK